MNILKINSLYIFFLLFVFGNTYINCAENREEIKEGKRNRFFDAVSSKRYIIPGAFIIFTVASIVYAINQEKFNLMTQAAIGAGSVGALGSVFWFHFKNKKQDGPVISDFIRGKKEANEGKESVKKHSVDQKKEAEVDKFCMNYNEKNPEIREFRQEEEESISQQVRDKFHRYEGNIGEFLKKNRDNYSDFSKKAGEAYALFAEYPFEQIFLNKAHMKFFEQFMKNMQFLFILYVGIDIDEIEKNNNKEEILKKKALLLPDKLIEFSRKTEEELIEMIRNYKNPIVKNLVEEKKESIIQQIRIPEEFVKERAEEKKVIASGDATIGKSASTNEKTKELRKPVEGKKKVIDSEDPRLGEFAQKKVEEKKEEKTENGKKRLDEPKNNLLEKGTLAYEFFNNIQAFDFKDCSIKKEIKEFINGNKQDHIFTVFLINKHIEDLQDIKDLHIKEYNSFKSEKITEELEKIILDYNNGNHGSGVSSANSAILE